MQNSIGTPNMGAVSSILSSFQDSVKESIDCIRCGANGIINAMMGAEVLQAILDKKEHSLTALFDPKRQ